MILPKIMVAPNGARLTKSDHPAVPVTIDEIVNCAEACYLAGAQSIHAHVRDSNGKHILDPGLYHELLQELSLKVPDIQVQITTEAVGRYTPEDQRKLIRVLRPTSVSIALREQLQDQNQIVMSKFYHWMFESGIRVQHILYDLADLQRLILLLANSTLVHQDIDLLCVLGRYHQQAQSQPTDLDPFLPFLNDLNPDDWSVCAFGIQETNCLLYAVSQGAPSIRVGFENNYLRADGTIAQNNAERITEILNFLLRKDENSIVT